MAGISLLTGIYSDCMKLTTWSIQLADVRARDLPCLFRLPENFFPRKLNQDFVILILDMHMHYNLSASTNQNFFYIKIN